MISTRQPSLADSDATDLPELGPTGRLAATAISLALNIRLGEDDLAQVPFDVCLPSGCKALLPLQERVVEAMRGGGTAQVRFLQAHSTPVALDLSLEGFAAALDALGTPSGGPGRAARGAGPPK